MESQTRVEGLLPAKTEPATSHKEACTDTEPDALVRARPTEPGLVGGFYE